MSTNNDVIAERQVQTSMAKARDAFLPPAVPANPYTRLRHATEDLRAAISTCREDFDVWYDDLSRLENNHFTVDSRQGARREAVHLVSLYALLQGRAVICTGVRVRERVQRLQKDMARASSALGHPSWGDVYGSWEVIYPNHGINVDALKGTPDATRTIQTVLDALLVCAIGGDPLQRTVKYAYQPPPMPTPQNTRQSGGPMVQGLGAIMGELSPHIERDEQHPEYGDLKDRAVAIRSTQMDVQAAWRVEQARIQSCECSASGEVGLSMGWACSHWCPASVSG